MGDHSVLGVLTDIASFDLSTKWNLGLQRTRRSAGSGKCTQTTPDMAVTAPGPSWVKDVGAKKSGQLPFICHLLSSAAVNEQP